MASNFSLDGSMIARSVARGVDQRSEDREEAESSTAVLNFRGRNHVVRLVNLSPSGAMVIFPHVPHIGEEVRLQLLERGTVLGQVCWVRNGRIGLTLVEADA